MNQLKAVVIIPFTILTTLINCQSGDYFLGAKQYPFIKYSDNKISFPSNDEYFDDLYQKLDSIILYGKGKINIVHIGGSHIQADIYTHQIRKRLQSIQHDMNGGRGLIFPFRMAKTNNPSNYRVNYTGDWQYAKNTQTKRTEPLGLSGIAVSTSDNKASIKINPNTDTDVDYSFTKIRVFHSQTHYQLSININDSLYTGLYDSTLGLTQFCLPESREFKLELRASDTINETISLYGFSLDNDNPGIIYTAIGVNGARLSSYLKCEYYSQHINALNPDLVIFSIGTNDGNTRYFDAEKYKAEYDQLIEITKVSAPNTHIMITVPNDCYYYKRYVNTNTAIIQKQIINLAQEKNYAVWDFYAIMGGLNSSMQWYNYGIMRYDRIHFSKEGYLLKGDLFVAALLRGWEKDLSLRTSLPEGVKEHISPSQISQSIDK